MGGGLPRRLSKSGLPDLPNDFVEHIQQMGKQGMAPSELIEELKKWKGMRLQT